MMKIIILILFVLFQLVSTGMHAQTSEIDSLENLLHKHSLKDTVRVNLLNKLAYELYTRDIDKTLRYAEEANDLSNQLNYEKGRAKSWVLKGIYYDEKSDFPAALTCYEKALGIYNKLNDKSGVNRCYNNMSIIFRYQGDYTSALEYNQKSLKIAEELNDKSSMSYSYNNIGIIYFYLGNYEKALSYYQKSLNIDKELNDKSGVAYSLNNIGIIYEYQANYPKALEYYQKSLNIKEELADRIGMAKSLNNMGAIYKYMQDYENAYVCYEKSLEINRAIGRKSTEAHSYNGLASLYLVQQKAKAAYRYSKKAYRLAQEIGSAELIKESAKIVSESASRLGYFKDAYKYHVVFKAMNDSLFNEKTIKKITELEFQYKYEKEKELEEFAQQKKDALQKEREKRQKNVRNSFIFGFVLMILLVLVVYRNLVQKRQANKMLAKQKREIEWKNRELFNKNEEIESQAKKLKSANEKLQESNTTKDKFFSIISHDLKSPFNAILGYSCLLSENYHDYDDDKKESMIKDMDTSARSAFKLLDDLLTWSRSQLGGVEYSPETIDLFALINETIYYLKGQAKSKHIDVVNEVYDSTTIFADKDMLSAILRNLISNAIKFTHEGGAIKIAAKNHASDTLIAITDTGVGIPKEKIPKIFNLSQDAKTLGTNRENGTGLGLILCKEFVEKHGGKIQVDSEVGFGSVFSFTIPNNPNI